MQHLEYAMQLSTMDGKLSLLLGKVLSKLLRLEPGTGGTASWKRVLQHYADACKTFCGGEDSEAADGDTPSPKRVERHAMEALCRLHRLRLQLILGRLDDSTYLSDASALQLAEQYAYLKVESDEDEASGEGLGLDSVDGLHVNEVTCSVDLPSAQAPLGLKLIESDGGMAGVFVLELEQPHAERSGVQRDDRIIAVNGKTIACLNDIFCIMADVRSKQNETVPISVTMRVAHRPEAHPDTNIDTCAPDSTSVAAVSSCVTGTTIRQRAVEKVAQFVRRACATATAADNARKVAESAASAALRASAIAATFVLSIPTACADDDVDYTRRFEAAVDALTALRLCQRAEKYDHRAAAAISQSLLLLSERKLVPQQVQTAIELIQQLQRCTRAGHAWARDFDISKHPCRMLNRWLLQLSYFRSDVSLQRHPGTSALCLMSAAQNRAIERTWRSATRFLTAAPRGCCVLAALYEAVPFSPAPDLIEAAGPATTESSPSVTTELQPGHRAVADGTAPSAVESTESVGERRSKRKRAATNSSRPTVAVPAPARTVKAAHLAQPAAVTLFNVHRGGRKLELTGTCQLLCFLLCHITSANFNPLSSRSCLAPRRT